MEDMKVTSIEDLRGYANGKVVELPPFDDGLPLIARMRRPSLMVLMKSGKIPNELLKAAQSIFTSNEKTGLTIESTDQLIEYISVFEIMAEAALIEPSFNDIKDNGLSLNDKQLMAIFNYSQQGVKALDSFREKQKNT